MGSKTGVCDLALQMHHVSLTAAGISLGIFTILTIIHTIQIVRTRTWYLLGVVFGGFCMCPCPLILGFKGALNSAQR